MDLLLRILSTLVVIVTLQESCVYGESTVLRDPAYPSNHSEGLFRTLTCVSEDDYSALVWNDDSDRNNIKTYRFIDSSTEGSGINCPLNDLEGCTGQWTLSDKWTIVNSFEKPTGPVLDKRWEDFTEIRSDWETGDIYVTPVNATGAIAFSTRGESGIRLWLCGTELPVVNTFYKVDLGDSSHNISAIYVCNNDVSKRSKVCEQEPSFQEHKESAMSPKEWRTFVVTWSQEKQTLNVYDEAKMLLTTKLLEGSEVRHIYFGSNRTSLTRFHLYNYIHATKENETLQSPELTVTDLNSCIEMLVALCQGCAMRINIVDKTKNSQMIRTIIPEPNSIVHGLPRWQHVRFNVTITDDIQKPVRLQVVTILQEHDPNPSWAAANVRTCKAGSAVRKSTTTVEQVLNKETKQFFWPKVGCQKLSYDGGSLVSSNSPINNKLEHDIQFCEHGKNMGPSCAVNCSSVIDNGQCRKVAVCIERGCICAQESKGGNCEGPSEVLNLRYANISDKGIVLQWNPPKYPNGRVTKYFVTLELAQLHGCSELGLPTEYERKTITVESNQVSLHDLHPYAKYNVTVVAFTTESGTNTIISFNTSASEIPTSIVSNLRLEEGTIKWEAPEDCTRISGPFRTVKLIFQGIDELVANFTDHRQTKNPFFVIGSSQKKPVQKFYGQTKYRVRAYIIRDYDRQLNATAFQELDFITNASAPSEILNLRHTNVSERGVVLYWNPPKYPNWIATKYFVTLELIELYGCSELKRPTKSERRTITVENSPVSFHDLHPYAKYKVTVGAFTTESGPKASIFFNTSASVIPTSILSNLRLEGDTIKWEWPEDCTRISGPFRTVALIFQGISDWMANFIDYRDTKKKYFVLGSTTHYSMQRISPETKYRVRAYIIRDYLQQYNSSAFQEMVFTTNPAGVDKKKGRR